MIPDTAEPARSATDSPVTEELSAAGAQGGAADLALGYSLVGLLSVLWVTGLFLMLHYRPHPAVAWQDLFDIRQEAVQSVFHELHAWSAHGVIVLMLAHLLRTVLQRSYRSSETHRYHGWLLGLLLLILTILLAWTGHRLATPSTQGEEGLRLLQIYVLHVAVLPLALAGWTFMHLRWGRRTRRAIKRPEQDGGQND